MDTPSGLRITLLGTGTSHGVPMIACDCPVCTSSDPHDRRTRASVMIEHAGRVLIIDTGPEFRVQCLANRVCRCDAVLYTHHHMDHVAGLDDLRRFNWLQRGPLPCYAQPATLSRLGQVFPYVQQSDPGYLSAKPDLQFIPIDGPFDVIGRTVTPIPLLHGNLAVLGFRLGNFAYCTDVSEIPAGSWALLEGLDVLILDALRRRPHPTHFHLDQAVETARRLRPRLTYFTHIAHELGHVQTNAELPDSMALGFDGQVIHCA